MKNHAASDAPRRSLTSQTAWRAVVVCVGFAALPLALKKAADTLLADRLRERVCAEYPSYRADRQIFERERYPAGVLATKGGGLVEPTMDALEPFVVGWETRQVEQGEEGQMTVRYVFPYPVIWKSELAIAYDSSKRLIGFDVRNSAGIEVSCD